MSLAAEVRPSLCAAHVSNAHTPPPAHASDHGNALPRGCTGECPRQRQGEDEERGKGVDVDAGETDH